MTIAAMVIVLVASAVVDVRMGGAAPPHAQVVMFTIVYSVLTSLLATAIVSRVLLELQQRQRRELVRDKLGVLGVNSARLTNTIAIVLPAFPIPGDTPVVDPNAYHHDEVALASAVARVKDLMLKQWDEIANYAYARRDMLLVADLIQMIGSAGLPPPILVSDYDFVEAVVRSKGAHTSGVTLPEGTDSRDLPVTVQTVIVVGLWSNLVTLLLAQNPSIPFILKGKGQDRCIYLAIEGDPKYEQHQPATPDATFGLIARLNFPGLCLSVIGGTDALGTARLGDLLQRRPDNCSDLWDVPGSDDLWAGLTSPGPGQRWADYKVWGAWHGGCPARRGTWVSVDRAGAS